MKVSLESRQTESLHGCLLQPDIEIFDLQNSEFMFALELERVRILHGENEVLLSECIEDILNNNQKNLTDDIPQQHRLYNRFQKIRENNSKLIDYYHNVKNGNINDLPDITASDDILEKFYGALTVMRQSRVTDDIVDVEGFVDSEVDLFSGEEFSGRFLDLHGLYQQFLNIKGNEFKCKYVKYLETLDDFSWCPKISKDYCDYLKGLLSYLKGYFHRVHPLYPVDKIVSKVEGEFKRNHDTGLYCEPCQKIFTNSSMFESHKQGKKHLKRVKNPLSSDANVELVEELVRVFVGILKSKIDDTVEFIKGMQTRTYEEIIAERTHIEEPIYEPFDAEDDAENIIYNPLKIPLGWDGKPIPYWLYKLHGLNIEYKCEICGNFSYFGPRQFERHFKENRHVEAMKALGIQNSEEYKNITLIQDAINLFQKLQTLDRYKQWRPEIDEEFEDGEGNVFNRKTYEDLKRQGLL